MVTSRNTPPGGLKCDTVRIPLPCHVAGSSRCDRCFKNMCGISTLSMKFAASFVLLFFLFSPVAAISCLSECFCWTPHIDKSRAWIVCAGPVISTGFYRPAFYSYLPKTRFVEISRISCGFLIFYRLFIVRIAHSRNFLKAL